MLRIFLLSLLILNILEKKYRKQKWKGNEKRDVKFHMSSTAQNNSDVNSKKKEHGTESKETKRQSDLPLVAILHDYVLNGVQGKRLERSMDLMCSSKELRKRMIFTNH